MPAPGGEFVLRTPEGHYLRGEGVAWSPVPDAAQATRFVDSHAALEALEAARAGGQVVDLYTTDDQGEFSVAVA